MSELYKESSDWMYDRYFSQGVWLRRAMVMIVLLIALLFSSITANLVLLPLKEKVPYLYAFDHVSGEVTQIGRLQPTDLTAKWEITRYFLIRFITNYEGYDNDNLDVPYQAVFAQADENVRKQYVSFVSSANPLSPYKMYGKAKYITVHINSINKLNDNTVDIKFQKRLFDRASNTAQTIEKEAIVRWRYDQTETTQKMLDRDPLGFKVTYYRATQVNVDKSSGV